MGLAPWERRRSLTAIAGIENQRIQQLLPAAGWRLVRTPHVLVDGPNDPAGQDGPWC